MILDLLSLIQPEALAPHKFAVEVIMESLGEVADIGSELGEGVDDFF